MATYKTADLIEFGAVMARNYPDLKVEQLQDLCDSLMKLENSMGGLKTKQCNNGWTEADAKRWESLKTKAFSIAEKFKLQIDVQGDCRGIHIKIKLPNGYRNSIFTELYCIPAKQF